MLTILDECMSAIYYDTQILHIGLQLDGVASVVSESDRDAQVGTLDR
jgi:hypothetical protein